MTANQQAAAAVAKALEAKAQGTTITTTTTTTTTITGTTTTTTITTTSITITHSFPSSSLPPPPPMVRERLFGTGSQTNAFTDFHHTVYFACCPVETMNLLGRPRPMLPMALDALSEVRR